MKFESIPEQEKRDKVFEQQRETLSPASAIRAEKTILESFRGRAKTLIPVLLMFSAVACGEGKYEQTGTSSTKETAKAVEVIGGEEKTSDKEQKVEVVGWAQEIVDSMKRDIQIVKTGEDAYFLVKKHYQQFVREFYFGQGQQEYTDGQLRFIMESAKELSEIIRGADERFNTDFSGFASAQLKDIELKAKRKLTYSYKSQKEIADKAPSIIAEYQKEMSTPKTFEQIVEEVTRGK